MKKEVFARVHALFITLLLLSTPLADAATHRGRDRENLAPPAKKTPNPQPCFLGSGIFLRTPSQEKNLQQYRPEEILAALAQQGDAVLVTLASVAATTNAAQDHATLHPENPSTAAEHHKVVEAFKLEALFPRQEE